MTHAFARLVPEWLTSAERAVFDDLPVSTVPMDMTSIDERIAATRTPGEPMEGVMAHRRLVAWLADERSVAYRLRMDAAAAVDRAMHEARVAEDTARADMARVIARLDEADVPHNAWIRQAAHAKWDGLAWRAIAKALTWRRERSIAQRDDVPVLCVLAGGTGCGKTAATVRAIAEWPRTAAFVPAATIGITPRNGYSTNRELWMRWREVALLVIDDLGTTCTDAEAFSSLLIDRWNLGGATIVSTNLDLTGVTPFVAVTRLADRVRGEQVERGLPWWHVVHAPSFRRLLTTQG